MNWDESESKEPISSPDTKNKTRINEVEGTDPQLDKNGKDKWKRLSNINTGAADSFGNRNESVVRMQERASTFDIMGDKLSLPDVYKREGRSIMKDLDTEKVTYTGSTLHLVCFCVAAHLVNRDERQRSYHQNAKPSNNDQHFLDVVEEFSFDEGTINSIYQKLSNMEQF